MSTMMSDCHRLSDFLMVPTFAAGFAMKNVLLKILTTKNTRITKFGPVENPALIFARVVFFAAIKVFVPFVLSVVKFFFLRFLAATPDDGVDQRRLARFDLGDGALHGGAD